MVLTALGRTVLLTSHTHSAVDNLLIKIQQRLLPHQNRSTGGTISDAHPVAPSERGSTSPVSGHTASAQPGLNILRLGNPAQVRPELRCYTLTTALTSFGDVDITDPSRRQHFLNDEEVINGWLLTERWTACSLFYF